jgi:hypothetical protein
MVPLDRIWSWPSSDLGCATHGDAGLAALAIGIASRLGPHRTWRPLTRHPRSAAACTAAGRRTGWGPYRRKKEGENAGGKETPGVDGDGVDGSTVGAARNGTAAGTAALSAAAMGTRSSARRRRRHGGAGGSEWPEVEATGRRSAALR